MAASVLDLSIITDELLDLLKAAFDPTSTIWTSHGGPIDPFNVAISGAQPEAVHDNKEGDCQLSLYLLHVSQDKFYRNTPVPAPYTKMQHDPAMPGPYPQLNRASPLTLDLYYLLSAFAKDNYNREQQAMGVALRCFHEHAIVLNAPEHYTLTMEAQTADEMSRLWQALSTPLRLSVVYKVSVAFITPTDKPVTPQPPPEAVDLAVAPLGTVSEAPARLFGAAVRESFIVPKGADAGHADDIPFVLAPGLVRSDDNLIVTGDGLARADYAKVYLRDSDDEAVAKEFEITAWRQAPVSPTDLRLHFPNTIAALPGAPAPLAASPPPGRYWLCVGSDGPKKRTNIVPVSVAAFIDHAVTPPAPAPHHLDPGVGGIFTINGRGFTTGKTEVFVGDAALADGGTGDGQFQIGGGGSQIQFKPPAALPSGTYVLRVRVNGIDSPPSWTIDK
jgi:Pvc16 N-terminal domain